MTTATADVVLIAGEDPRVALGAGPDPSVQLTITEAGIDELTILEAVTPDLFVLEGVSAELLALEAPAAQISIGPTLADTTPLSVHSNTGAVGTSATAARGDHVHPHGNLNGGLLHALATTESAGFLATNDKRKLLDLSEGNDDELLIADTTQVDKFRYGKLFNANVANDAAIAGTKLLPNFGDQNITTNGDLTVSDALVTGNLTVNGTFTTVITETVEVTDKVVTLGNVETPTDTTADDGGIILKGTTDKTILWKSSSASWTFNQPVNLTNGNTYRINNIMVLSATSLGQSVVSSSLTSVGTITSGSWDEGTY
jgi:hypothetical protein